MKKCNFTKKQLGFFSIELILVMVVALLVLAGVATRGAKLFGSTEVSDELSNLSSLITATKELKTASGYGVAATSLIPALSSTDGIPKSMTATGTTIANSWGGAVTIASTGNGFTITYNAVPKEACVKLVTKAALLADTSKIAASAAITGEVTTAVAQAQCTGTTNILVWSMLS